MMAAQPLDLAFIADWNDHASVAPPPAIDYQGRALDHWPGLDRRRLRQAKDDPLRIARLVSRRTSQPIETILALLLGVG